MNGTTLTGKRVVVTGAAGLLGGWISEAFAREGARLLLTDSRDDPLQASAERLRESGTDVVTCVADMMDESDIEALCRLSADHWGSPDVLVNNAGVYPGGWLMEASRADVERMATINVMAPFQLTQSLAKQMIRHQVHGSIVNVSSSAAHSARPGFGPYSMSKAALAMMTRVFALELGPAKIRVNSVDPGFAPGGEFSTVDPSHAKLMTESIPLGRTSGAHDAPAAIVFLCSERSSFITGSTVTVDGGRTAGTFHVERDGRVRGDS